MGEARRSRRQGHSAPRGPLPGTQGRRRKGQGPLRHLTTPCAVRIHDGLDWQLASPCPFPIAHPMSVAGETVRQHDDHVAGILWMLATVLCFISLDTLMKDLLQTY